MTMTTLPVLVINPHSRCNCRCSMCDIWKSGTAQEISPNDLERQIESIERLRVEWVVFSGGEPLMHSDLWRLSTMLRERDIRITLLSSGLLLGKHAGAIVRHVDDVIVSLDGPREVHNAIRGVPRAFELLAAGVARVREVEPRFPISARSTVQRANFDCLVRTTDAARDLALDSISFLAADLESTAFRRPDGWTAEKKREISLREEEIIQLEAEIEALIERDHCGTFVRESPAKLRKIVHHFRAQLGEATAVAPLCNAPWVSCVVEADGSVRPCFFHAPVGNVRAAPLEQILNGPVAKAFRQNLDVATNPVCRKCVCSLNWKPGVSKAENASGL
jgi:MoaA/NifB/PqqE/SkfB family radical SAM enzyme